MFLIMTNKDCKRCCYQTTIQDGGDCENIVPWCILVDHGISYVVDSNKKPCTLPDGEFYVAVKNK